MMDEAVVRLFAELRDPTKRNKALSQIAMFTEKNLSSRSDAETWDRLLEPTLKEIELTTAGREVFLQKMFETIRDPLLEGSRPSLLSFLGIGSSVLSLEFLFTFIAECGPNMPAEEFHSAVMSLCKLFNFGSPSEVKRVVKRAILNYPLLQIIDMKLKSDSERELDAARLISRGIKKIVGEASKSML